MCIWASEYRIKIDWKKIHLSFKSKNLCMCCFFPPLVCQQGTVLQHNVRSHPWFPTLERWGHECVHRSMSNIKGIAEKFHFVLFMFSWWSFYISSLNKWQVFNFSACIQNHFAQWTHCCHFLCFFFFENDPFLKKMCCYNSSFLMPGAGETPEREDAANSLHSGWKKGQRAAGSVTFL